MDDVSILRYLRFIKEESIQYKVLEMEILGKYHHSKLDKSEARREPVAGSGSVCNWGCMGEIVHKSSIFLSLNPLYFHQNYIYRNSNWYM